MELSIFKSKNGIYRVNDGAYESMLSRYGILEDIGEEQTSSSEKFAVDGTRVKFFAKREVTIDLCESGAGFEAEIALSDGERIFGLADANRESTMIRGMNITLWKENVKCYGPMPIILSSEGWAIFFNTTYKTRFDVGCTDPDVLRMKAWGGGVDIFVFIEDSLISLVKKITCVTGRPMILPKFAYGFTVVNNEEIGVTELLEYSRLYREKDIPCDCMGLEPYWMEKYYDFSTDKKWDIKKFGIPYWHPQNTSAPGTFFHPLRRMGMQLSLWLCEDYDLLYNEEHDLEIKASKTGFHEDAEVLDKHLASASIYQDKITKRGERWFEHLKKFVDNGASAFKLDASNQVLEHPDRLWGGKFFDSEVHNVYPVLLAKEMANGYREYTDRRLMINTSCAYVGTQKYAATWAGDTGGGPKTLVSVMNYAMCGHSNSGCDIDVNNIATMHYGFLMPWTQQNNWNSWSYPWYLGDELMNIYRFYSKLRSSLFPYIYYTAYQAHKDGVPMLRPLSLVYGESNRFDNVKNCYMLGDSLFVGAFDMHLSLPDGKWVDYFTGDVYEGGKDIDYVTPEGIGGALFVKSGAVIVTMTPQSYIMERDHEYIINVYPSEREGETAIYEDDGYTYDYESGGCALTRINSSGVRNGSLTLCIDKRVGGFEGRPNNGHSITSNSIPKIEASKPLGELKVVIHGAHISRATLNGKEIKTSVCGEDTELRVCADSRVDGAKIVLEL